MALRTQQIIGYEAGVADSADPWRVLASWRP